MPTLIVFRCWLFSAAPVPAPMVCSAEMIQDLVGKGKKVKEADLYSAFIEVPYTQGDRQVRITQCYLQTTPYLPLPRKHSPDGASQTEVADI